MHKRLALLLLVIAALSPAPRASAADGGEEHVVLAQDVGEKPGEANVGEEEEAQQTGGEEEGGGAAKETGAKEEEAGGGAQEEGPPWTYQMAKLAVAMVLFLGLGIAVIYRRLLGPRRIV